MAYQQHAPYFDHPEASEELINLSSLVESQVEESQVPNTTIDWDYSNGTTNELYEEEQQEPVYEEYVYEEEVEEEPYYFYNLYHHFETSLKVEHSPIQVEHTHKFDINTGVVTIVVVNVILMATLITALVSYSSYN